MKLSGGTKLVLIGALTIILILFGVVSLITKNHKTNNASTTGPTSNYYDPASKNTISTQTGKVPDTNGNPNTGPLFAGFEALFNQGLSLQQINGMKTAFQNYKPFNTNNTQISLNVDSVKPGGPDSNDPNQRFYVTANVVVNQKTTYPIKLYYSGLYNIQLIIYKPDLSGVLFDSGNVTGS